MMQWESWSAFWSMGGTGAYVWGSYAVTALLVAVELVLVFRRRRITVNRLLSLRRVVPARQAFARRANEEN